MDNKTRQKKVPKYFCKICDYSCSKQSDFQKHCQTIKHFSNLDNRKLAKTRQSKVSSEYVCECGKKYKYQSGLCKHKRYCSFINDCEYENETMDEVNTIAQKDFISILKQNQEFKEMILDQNKTIMELSKRSNITNNTTNNNQKFNLNFFLNTTCKDAMNMSEFIENINIEFQDIENIGKNGYVAGMTDMIISRIKDMEVTKRPLHCTDKKRETLYIKENDWVKDDNYEKISNVLKKITNKQFKTIKKWVQENPNYNNNDILKDEYIQLVTKCTASLDENERKLIKNICNNVYLENK